MAELTTRAPHRRHVVVVGAGISGLVAARDLLQTCDVTVLEAAGHVGGVLQRADVGGLTVDLGAESMLARRPEGRRSPASWTCRSSTPPRRPPPSRPRPGSAPCPPGPSWACPARPRPSRGCSPPTPSSASAPNPTVPRPPSSTTSASPTTSPTASGRTSSTGSSNRSSAGLRRARPTTVVAGHRPRALAARRPRRLLLTGLGPAPTVTGPVFAGVDGGLARLPLALHEHLLAHGADVRTGPPCAS